MEGSGGEIEMAVEMRRYSRLRVQTPFACSFARIGLQRWLAEKRAGLGVVFDVSLNGAKVMSPFSLDPGDQLAVSLRLPDQAETMNVDATVRWGSCHTFGLEFTMLSRRAKTRLQRYLSRTLVSQT
jgi:hypothetical protein